jgi:membrane fusion protein (multidrug efflux system)
LHSIIDGTVKNIYVENEQYITTGQLLFELEHKQLEVDLVAAEADLLIAEEKLRIAEIPLNEDHTTLLTQTNYYIDNNDFKSDKIINLQRAVDNQQKIVNQIKINLLNTKIYSPATGWINNLSLKPFDQITTQQPLAGIILQEENFWVEANFTENQLQYMQPGQKAEVKLAMYPDYTFAGIVKDFMKKSDSTIWKPNNNLAIKNPNIDEKIVTVRIEIDNSSFNLPLKIGNAAKTIIHTNPLVKKISNKKYS